MDALGTESKADIGAKFAGKLYRGKQTKTGNPSGFRFEGAHFKSHPEENGKIPASVFARGRLLFTAAAPYVRTGAKIDHEAVFLRHFHSTPEGKPAEDAEDWGKVPVNAEASGYTCHGRYYRRLNRSGSSIPIWLNAWVFSLCEGPFRVVPEMKRI